ncbi:MAG: hypothetical protein H0X64_13525 [Gemmatimonadaceae bacterium]|nr:hypothetical protein [Gemmatimonadaceae bacterium]
MPLTISDFLLPAGELSESMFPDLDLDEALTDWLAQAIMRTDNENAQRHLVLHRAYTVIANRFHLEAASETKGSESASRSSEQFRYWNRKAARHLASYRSIGVHATVTEVRPVW